MKHKLLYHCKEYCVREINFPSYNMSCFVYFFFVYSNKHQSRLKKEKPSVWEVAQCRWMVAAVGFETYFMDVLNP